MAKLTIKNPHVDSSKNRFPTFHVFLDNRPVGSVFGPTQSLELDVAAGEHTIQIRSAQILGRSNRLTLHLSENNQTIVHITEKVPIYFAIIIGFLALYYMLRVHLNLNFLIAAGAGVAALYTAVTILHPIHITQVNT